MRNHTSTLLCLLFSLGVSAQAVRQHPGLVPQRIDELRSAGTSFASAQLFTEMPRAAQTEQRWRQAVDQAVLLAPDAQAFAQVLSQRPTYLSLQVPTTDVRFTVDLEEVHPFSDDFNVVVASTGGPFPYTQGLHYRGSVRGEPNSLVAISIFKNELMGFVSTPAGDWTIGKLDGDADGAHIVYRTSDLKDFTPPVCDTPDDGHGYSQAELTPSGDDRTAKCVRIYWEVNYDIFQGKGSVTNATNYVTGLFNLSAILYNNDGISVTLSQVFVWDVVSPYTSTSTSTLLDQFGAYRTSFNGDIANLLGYAGGGGIAWLTGLCISNTAHKMGYSGISSNYNNVPTYSWSVEVVTHEQGHILGSRHTHACAWNGNNTAIDGCGPTAGYSEGSCATGPLPSGGGTIMSYCHLVSGVGINFNNGFGPQPTTVIVNNINNAACLAACAGSSCGVPGGLSAGSLSTTGAMLAWGAVSGASSYTLQWKLTSASSWTTVTGLTSTQYSLSGLTANTSYQFQVLTVCTGGSSAYSTAATFTTLAVGGCPDIQEANNSTATAGTIASGTTYNALIATGTDVDYYKLVLSSTSNITVSLSNLAGDYDVQLLNSSGTQVAISQAGGTTAESITYNAASAGNYYVYVYGYNGTSSATMCYALVATATGVSTCTDNFEPNETNGGARTVGANSTNTARIGSATDVDWFKFANTSAQKYIKVTLTNLPANYNMRLYRGSGLLATSANTGTANEQIIYNSNTVSSNYKVNVYGASGAFNATSCYTLTVQISATAFLPSGEMISDDEAVLADDDGGELMVFPNPASDAVTILLPPSERATRVDMMDAMGRPVNGFTSQVTLAEQRFVIDVHDLSYGIYFVRASDGEHEVVKRVIVQR